MTNNLSKQKKYDDLVKEKLSEYLGIEKDDISDEDSLKDDLHMNASELSDFIHMLNKVGYDINLTSISEMETVADLIEIVSENAEF